ncbi:4-hydroxyproline epimerase [Stakelama pacifica]|uniref:4-hydroxyproline epimerase n=1 Tax=Stakelama pacifica TaxID=517720 RepID=A0A4R6FX23_9SPHN|nr:4-hydroxyproline epimerase [Stakelama pacifica]TDN86451.1 4-hydroxyproline epimerase [Stakelama pacifica]GGO89682.1 hydroxyproline-2-epimerase [Stakelama pacifica]
MRHTFFCIDGHTAGNPVRLVAGGAPPLKGANMSERRQDFLARFDWIRTGLCFEPRGHDMMSGGFLYPPTREDADVGILFIETSGCLPMCGHGTIGIITFGIEHGLIHPAEPGRVRAEVPAGLIDIRYEQSGNRVTSVRITNIASYVAARDIRINVEGIGPLTVDISYGGNFYAIVEPQGSYAGLDAMGAARLLDLSPKVRAAVREQVTPVHPVDPTIQGVSHVLWADTPKGEGAHGRNAVFYGDRAIDRSPCGTGTSARIAHLRAAGRLSVGESFVHESYIGSRFTGRIEREVMLGDHPAIIPSIEGSAIATGLNTIWIDEEDLFWRGFQVT